MGAPNAGGVGQNQRLSINSLLYLENGIYKIDARFLLKSNRKSYVLYRMVTLPMTLSDPLAPPTTPICTFCAAIHSFATGEPRDFKFGTLFTIASPTLPMRNLPWQGQATRFRILHPMLYLRNG